MKRALSLCLLLLLPLLSCGGEPSPTVPRRTRPPTQTAFPGQGEQGQCGDGLCEGPENPSNCPADCPPPEITSGTSPASPAVAAEWTLSLAQAPDAAPIRPLIGVNAGPLPAGEAGKADLTAAYQQIGVNLVRTHDYYGPLDMAVLYPDRSADPADPRSYDFAESDRVFTSILAGGFEPYLRLGDSWSNATPPRTPQERANWVRAAVEVLRHYRQGQWDGFESDFRYVEIWNEPDHPQFWPEPRTQQEFLQLFAETAQALRQAFPEMQVGGPGFTPAGALTAQGNRYVYDFLDCLRAEGTPLDFLSWHMYANDPDSFAQAAAFYRQALDEHGYEGTALHISEWNTGLKDGMSNEEQAALRLGGKGTAILTAAWISLQQQGVAESLFYRGNDSSAEMATWYGLFYADGRPKRIALAFSLWSELAAHPQRLQWQARSVEGAAPLWLLAGQDRAGEIALLLANPNDEATSWHLASLDGQEPAVGALRIYQVGDAGEEIETLPATGPTVEIGAYTVQLLLATR
ncbi:MAG: hypothetical protein JXA37_14600 [Chloroflexia bacterium]|nr:hypothetical protein [Chloroflexia bacterium]